MNRGDMAFKLGISFVSIAEIVGLLYLGVYQAVLEYNPGHETTGLAIMIICSLGACAVFLEIAYLTMRWKGQDSKRAAQSV